MNRRIDNVVSELRRRGILTSGELQAALGVSQATLSRVLSEQSEHIVRIGRARATRYGLARDIGGLGSEWPLYQIRSDGTSELVGRLYALAGNQWYLQQSSPWETLRGSEFHDGIYPDLPWFLQDLRPRGFLGRILARGIADEMGVPEDPRDWCSDDIARFLLLMGSDLPGGFVLGQRALEKAQSEILNPQGIIDGEDRERVYLRLADAVMGGEVVGSFAAGEQPKFTARVHSDIKGSYDVIVKFSGRGGRAEDLRWTDLLVAEHVANGILSEAGIACACTSLLQADGRCFLESVRFDRTEPGGRVGIVTLEAFDGAFFGAMEKRWTDAAERYRRTNWLSDDCATQLQMVWWFGNLIGNTDMHYGNASLCLRPNLPLSLAPVYDMVPMLYRPGIEGLLPDNPISPVPPPPEAMPIWIEAVDLAERFWSELAKHSLASVSFKDIASRNLDAVTRMRGQVMTGGNRRRC
jgi:hypothetical protein